MSDPQTTAIAALLLFMLVSTPAKADDCFIIAWQHLPPNRSYGDCNSFYCPDSEYKTLPAWISEIKKTRDKQTDKCIKNGYDDAIAYIKDEWSSANDMQHERDKTATHEEKVVR